jgi:hypothetical protein
MIQIAQFHVKPEKVSAFTEGVRSVVAALSKAEITGVKYAVIPLEKNVLQGILQLVNREDNPLPSLPEGKAFLEQLPLWIIAPPRRYAAIPAGSFHLLCEAGA